MEAKRFYHVNEGALISRNDPEFPDSSSIYKVYTANGEDKAEYGYFDSAQYEVFDVECAKKACAARNKDNYYFIITDQGMSEDAPDWEMDEDGILMTEDWGGLEETAENIVYYEALFDGNPIAIKGAPVKNALIPTDEGIRENLTNEEICEKRTKDFLASAIEKVHSNGICKPYYVDFNEISIMDYCKVGATTACLYGLKDEAYGIIFDGDYDVVEQGVSGSLVASDLIERRLRYGTFRSEFHKIAPESGEEVIISFSANIKKSSVCNVAHALNLNRNGARNIELLYPELQNVGNFTVQLKRLTN